MASTPLSYGVAATSRSEPILPREHAAKLAANARKHRTAAEDLGDFVSLCEPPSGARSALGDPWEASDSEGRTVVWCPSRRYQGASPLLQLHEDLLDFREAYRPTSKEHDLRDGLVKRVGDLVEQLWSGASVRVFGSFSTGLYLPESDIDLVCVGTGLEDASKQERGRALHCFAEALRAASWRHTQLEVIDKAKVPIAKFVDVSTGISVDVCIETRDGLISSSLARKASAQFPEYNVLVLVLKRFLHERGLHDTFSGGVGSYLLQLMVICAMQHPLSMRASSRGNMGLSLLHFLELFGLRLNYERVGIIISNGGRRAYMIFLLWAGAGWEWMAPWVGLWMGSCG